MAFVRQTVALDYGRMADPDILYYNANIQSTNTSDRTPNNDPQVVFQETRSAPLLNDAEDFMFSIVRFSLNGANKSLPLWIPRIKEQSTWNPNTLGEKISLIGSDASGVAVPNTLKVVEPNIYGGTPTAILNACLPTGFVATLNSANRIVISRDPAISLPANVSPNFTLNLPTNIANATGFGPGPFTGTGASSYTAGSLVAVFGNVDETVYSVTVGVDISGQHFDSAETFLIWSPENADTVPPGLPVNKQDLTTDYYYAYTYDKFCSMWNTAAAAAVDDAWNQAYFSVPSLTPSPTPPATLYPKLVYDPATRLFSIYSLADSWGDSALTPNGPNGQWQLYVNVNCENLISNFDTNYYYNNTVPGEWNKIQIYDKGQQINTVLLPPTGGSQDLYWKMTQNYPSTGSLWSPCDAIVFTSSYIPVAKEQVGDPFVFITDNIGYGNPTSPAAFQAIIGDTAIDQADGAEATRNFVLYNPTAEYRMSDMSRGNNEIRNIDIQVWWRNRLDNNLYPVLLTNGATASFKFMFRRRGVV